VLSGVDDILQFRMKDTRRYKAAIDVLSDVSVELAGAMLISIPSFSTTGDWSRLTISVVLFILSTYIAVILRRHTYDKSE
jgi:hypothetical protein